MSVSERYTLEDSLLSPVKKEKKVSFDSFFNSDNSIDIDSKILPGQKKREIKKSLKVPKKKIYKPKQGGIKKTDNVYEYTDTSVIKEEKTYEPFVDSPVKIFEDTYLIYKISVFGNELKIPAQSAVYTETNIVLYNKLNSNYYRAVENAYIDWLQHEYKQFLKIKEGVIKNSATGRLKIMVYNKSNEHIKISEGSVVAQLVLKEYEYM